MEIESREKIAHSVAGLLEAWNRHDADQISGYFAPDYQGVDIAEPRFQQGRTAVIQMARRYFQAFPDIQFQMEELIIERNRAVIVGSANGSHRGPLLNIPPSNRMISVQGVSILTFNERHIIRGFYLWDLAGFLRSIGLLPEL